MENERHIQNAPLGKRIQYRDQYSPALLFPVPRKLKRDEIQVPSPLPFRGYDIWNAFEISWLNNKGKPVVALGVFEVPCESPYIVESKSVKLYLNSLNGSKFDSWDQVTEILRTDLSQATGMPVLLRLFPVESRLCEDFILSELKGRCLDGMDVECREYQPNPELLTTENHESEEVLYSHLLKSNCLVTGQPDWGSIQIRYQGPHINHEGLLKYMISFRDHNEFHEQCVERIFMDISRKCRPRYLSVYARYSRRGGLDINPFRTNFADGRTKNIRIIRQ